MGIRAISLYGSITVEDLTNKGKAVVIMNTYEKSGFFKKKVQGSKDKLVGVIFNDPSISGDKESIQKNYSKNMEYIKDIKALGDIDVIAEIEGGWLDNLKINK